MRPIWFKILCAKAPEEFSADDWKELRKIANNIYRFDHERRDKITTRLCNILGYGSVSDIGKKREEASQAIDFLIEFEKKRKRSGLGVEPFCENAFTDNEGVTSNGQTLRNKYYKYKNMINMTTDELFEFEFGMTCQEFIEAESEAEKFRKKVKISRGKPKSDI
jgi:hypothetical protein